MDRTENRRIRASAGDALAKAFEMIATPAIFGVGGWLIDGRLGTFPLVTLILAIVVFSYQIWSFARSYSTDMDAALESRRHSYAGPGGQDSRGGPETATEAPS